jgi:hypothetical protein
MPAAELLAYLDDRAGDHHRGTARYNAEDTKILYLRDDLKKTRLSSEVDRMLRRLRPESSPKEEQSFPFGDLHATARLFDEAIILHFPTGTNRGIVVSLEPETARQLNTFIGECQKRLLE